jgi:lysophospholipase L1-like esterase
MVAGAAGYGVGVLRAPTSPGLEQQITQGAMISADSRTHKVTPAAAARVSAETLPPTPASTSGGGAHAYQAKIPGSKVTAIGDSVMLAAAPQLQAALKGIYIDAAVSRQMSAGLAVVQGLADAGLLRSVVVLDLGTNGTVTTRQIRQLLATIGPHHTLVLVNTFVPRPWQNEDNRVLAAAARKHDNVVLANWFATIEHRTGLLWDDDVHPRPQGATLYARMVATAVQATRSPRPTASPWSATCHTP